MSYVFLAFTHSEQEMYDAAAGDGIGFRELLKPRSGLYGSQLLVSAHTELRVQTRDDCRS